MATGIVAEYNPFHKGHKYHIDKTRELTGGDIVAVMSGSFVQRGEPAVFDKYIRTRAALLNGVSMVLELPLEYATGAADVFSYGAMHILEKSRIVDTLSFGSEEGNTKIFEKTANLLNNEPNELKELIKKYSDTGLSYPAARGKALTEYTGEGEDIFNSPNNILALEYIRQLKLLNSSIKPITIKRAGADYNSSDLKGEFSSALAIRTALKENQKSALKSVPEVCRALFEKEKITILNDFSPMLSYALVMSDKKALSEIADVTEGLENRILDCGFKNISELVEEIKTKRYAQLKIQRALLHILLDIKKEDQKKLPKYIRVLGFRKDKEYLLSELTKKSELPVIINVKENEELLEKEIKATDLYNAVRGGERGVEYRMGVIVV